MMMNKISQLCENGDLESLIDFVGNKSMAIGFMVAHEEMRQRSNDPAYAKLNEIHDEMQLDEEE